MGKFKEDDRVTVVSDMLKSSMGAGSIGRVWAVYNTEPPAYEVNFPDADGEDFDCVMYEDEIELAEQENTVTE